MGADAAPPPPMIVTPVLGQPWPEGFTPPGAPYGVMVMNGVTYKRPAPVRWICFRRDRKLVFFLIIAVMAGLIMVLLFALTFPAAAITVIAVLLAIVFLADYLVLGHDCSTDPLTGALHCAGMAAK